jgi:hypothetical protein
MISGLLCYTATGASGEGRGFGLTSPTLNALLNVSRSLPSITVNKNDDGCAKAIPLHLAIGVKLLHKIEVACHQGDQIW